MRSTVFFSKFSRRAATNHQHPDDNFATQQRRHHPRAIAGEQDDLVEVRDGFFPQVGDLGWLPVREEGDGRIIKADVVLRQNINQPLIDSVGSAQAKFPCVLVESVDGAGSVPESSAAFATMVESTVSRSSVEFTAWETAKRL